MRAMALLKELGTAVRQRRQEIGLSQQQLADLVELSRATVNELETGRLKDLSSHRIERVANELGFAVGLVGTRRSPDKSALEAAARVASVPYASELPASTLLESIRDGAVPPGYIPHLRTCCRRRRSHCWRTSSTNWNDRTASRNRKHGSACACSPPC
jgi:transcriptional regulator with XRE-family HTH domain